MRATQLFREFFESEKAGGLILISCTAISLLIANSSLGHGYHAFWLTRFGGLTLEHWVNDGLMALFFLLVGLEIEREIYKGELSNLREALFPMFGAVGGILVPAAIYLFFNYSTTLRSGAGIPMATDIAFALGILSLLGNRVPISLKVFLTALAIMDDLCAILVIALFYTKGVVLSQLLISLGIFALLLLLNRLRVRNLIPYILGGAAMWYFMLHSGVHATITGVLLAFAIPFGDGDRKSPSYILQHSLHKPISFGILPVFALANTLIHLQGNPLAILQESYGTGIALGLLLGKPAGIVSLAYLAVKIRLCSLPAELNWIHIFGVGILGGIGFTMSIFITLLAFDDPVLVNNVKLVILLSSLTAGLLGYLVLKLNLKPTASDDEP